MEAWGASRLLADGPTRSWRRSGRGGRGGEREPVGVEGREGIRVMESITQVASETMGASASLTQRRDSLVKVLELSALGSPNEPHRGSARQGWVKLKRLCGSALSAGPRLEDQYLVQQRDGARSGPLDLPAPFDATHRILYG